MFIIALHGIVLLAVGWGTDPNPEPPSSWGQSWDQYVIFCIFCFYTQVLCSHDYSKYGLPHFLTYLSCRLSVICRIIVYGFAFSCPPVDDPDSKQPTPPPSLAFLRHSWNRIDFLSVVCYWVDFALLCSGQEIIDDWRRILVFKALSTLILLRLLNITNGNRVILQSLKKSGPLLVTVTSFVAFFLIIFA